MLAARSTSRWSRQRLTHDALDGDAAGGRL